MTRSPYGRLFNSVEDKVLTNMAAAGNIAIEIAESLDRSEYAIRVRARELDITIATRFGVNKGIRPVTLPDIGINLNEETE